MKKTINKNIFSYIFGTFTNFLKENAALNALFLLICDAPDFWQLRLQNLASAIIKRIMLFNKHLLFIIFAIIILTGCILFYTVFSFDELNNSKSANFFHLNELEIVWISLPALTLFTLASPSFSLLYSMDEISIPDFSIKISGYPWFRSYDISDFLSCLQTTTLKYACYMVSNEELRNCKGFFRNLETNKKVILFTNTHMRLLVSVADVLYSRTIPSFGLKIDACPGRLNQVNLFIKKFGVFFGPCSEICGVNRKRC